MHANQNPFAQPVSLYVWHIQAEHITDTLLDLLSDTEIVYSVTAQVLDNINQISLYSDCAPGNTAMITHMDNVALCSNQTLTLLQCEAVEARDWVSETQKSITPQIFNDIVVIGSHHDIRDIPHGKTPILLDAGAAFGTGEHATTTGCLHAIATLRKRHKLRNVLDMGCGTAILGMAVAATCPARVMVVDNDRVAVGVARENILRNGLSSTMRAYTSEGFRHPAIRQQAPYDLIIANILARPVRSMAHDIYSHLTPNGHAVLSGFYTRDIRFVISRYLNAGMKLTSVTERNQWATVTVSR